MNQDELKPLGCHNYCLTLTLLSSHAIILNLNPLNKIHVRYIYPKFHLCILRLHARFQNLCNMVNVFVSPYCVVVGRFLDQIFILPIPLPQKKNLTYERLMQRHRERESKKQNDTLYGGLIATYMTCRSN